ncbi:glycosyltransferase family 2 protein [Aquiflexum sp. TKW24L]|uniref:glycosyltransferase n=1 Tax=Aquiflexum sp. TKW24L TaxID=2942212 RepID=UPI0020BE5282|nr:glycosyltransferase [Aquiflexum sp. TKW24L]MCL6261227.1 glycosyltransferase family 2 protein [Aquiflexum sp. TKW24L]
MTRGISILICTYNGSSKLKETLDYIKKLKFDHPWELIVVDNNSTDNTFDFVGQELNESVLDFSIYQCNTPGKMNAFWLGVRNAKYAFVLDCDDDNWLFPDYLQKAFEILEANKAIGALGGKGIPHNINDFPSWFEIYQSTYAVGPQGRENGNLGKNGELYGAGTFFRKDILEKWSELGFTNFLSCRKGTELTSGGDTELCEVVKLFGYEVWYEESLQFFHDIEDRKLTEDYLFKLKKGIASSFPVLYAYKFKNHKSFSPIRAELRGVNYQHIKGYVLSSIIYFIKRDLKNKVLMINYRQLIRSYFKNLKETERVFLQLKKHSKIWQE